MHFLSAGIADRLLAVLVRTGLGGPLSRHRSDAGLPGWPPKGGGVLMSVRAGAEVSDQVGRQGKGDGGC